RMRGFMVNRLVVVGLATMLVLTATAPVPTAAVQTPAAPQPRDQQSAAPSPRQLFDRYCVSCHNQRPKTAGQQPARKLPLDDPDITRVADHAETWERVVRKMRAGMMPPTAGQ